MTDSKPAAADPVSDGLVVRGRPPFAMTPTSLLRNPSVSSHAVRLWSVLASCTYGDQATDRPSRAAPTSTQPIAANSDSSSTRISATIRTARSSNSGGYPPELEDRAVPAVA